jgi:DNA-binding response OmpR family regulator
LNSLLTPLGFSVAEAASGAQCVTLATARSFDLILLDLRLRDAQGDEVATRLRELGCKASIIIVSANAYLADRTDAHTAGCDDFIAKPIEFAELLRKVKLHLGLDWHYQGSAAPPTPEIDLPMVRPPNEYLQALAAHAKIGDLRGLSEQLQALVRADPSHRAFADQLQTLAREFRLGDIKRLLKEEA